jgi:hypothetical protein
MSLPPSPAPTKSVNTEKNSCPVTPPASLDQDLFPSLLVLNLYVILIFLCLLLLSFLFVFYTIIDCAFVLICISKRTKWSFILQEKNLVQQDRVLVYSKSHLQKIGCKVVWRLQHWLKVSDSVFLLQISLHILSSDSIFTSI